MSHILSFPGKSFSFYSTIIVKISVNNNKINLKSGEKKKTAKKKAARHGLLSAGFPVGPQGRRPRGA